MPSGTVASGDLWCLTSLECAVVPVVEQRPQCLVDNAPPLTWKRWVAFVVAPLVFSYSSGHLCSS